MLKILSLISLGLIILMSDNGIRVLDFVNNHPGCHFRRIKKELGLSMGTIQYQLNKLRKR